MKRWLFDQWAARRGRRALPWTIRVGLDSLPSIAPTERRRVPGQPLRYDPATPLELARKVHESLADVVTDIVQNAIESGADTIDVTIREDDGQVAVDVVDNGRGMDAETLKRVADPFYTDGIKHPERTVGLGVAFLLQLVEAVGGSHAITSKPGAGTEVSFSLPDSHIDLPPVGAIDGATAARRPERNAHHGQSPTPARTAQRPSPGPRPKW